MLMPSIIFIDHLSLYVDNQYLTMRVAIIGAGVAGLTSARRCLENGFEPVVYERSKEEGGTWIYDERTGLDEFGMPIHTSMYQNLMYAINNNTYCIHFSIYSNWRLEYGF